MENTIIITLWTVLLFILFRSNSEIELLNELYNSVNQLRLCQLNNNGECYDIQDKTSQLYESATKKGILD